MGNCKFIVEFLADTFSYEVTDYVEDTKGEYQRVQGKVKEFKLLRDVISHMADTMQVQVFKNHVAEDRLNNGK